MTIVTATHRPFVSEEPRVVALDDLLVLDALRRGAEPDANASPLAGRRPK